MFVAPSIELLVLLYRHVQVDSGLPAITQEQSAVALPDELRLSADRFFRGDIALGMNLIPLVYEHRWHSTADLAVGIGTVSPHDLARAMLRPPDASVAECHRRDRVVTEALAGKAKRTSLLAALTAERFDTAAAEDLVDHPDAAAQTLARVLHNYAQVIAPDEDHLLEPLAAAAQGAEKLLAEHPLVDVVEQLVPQWRFHDLATFDSIVLIPSRAIAPFLSARFRTSQLALIVYPTETDAYPPTERLAAALKAIAHPLRLEILRIATATPITGQQLAHQLGLAEATVHHHTSLLRTAGLLTSNRDAHCIYHAAAPEALDRLLRDTRHTIKSTTSPRSTTSTDSLHRPH